METVIVPGLLILVGLSLGMLGGGATLTVPVLVYAGKLAPAQAISMSLLMVSLAAAAGSFSYLYRRMVDFRVAALFIVFGSAGAFLGAPLTSKVSAQNLMMLFGALMAAIAGLMLLRRDPASGKQETGTGCRPGFWLSAFGGLLVGFLTGFLGVGGGFLIVPVLASLLGCSAKAATGTSLVIIAVNAMAGFVGHSVALEPAALLINTAALLVGVAAGSRIAFRFADRTLSRLFAVLIFFTGTLIMFRTWITK